MNFAQAYAKTLALAEHKNAVGFLALMSFLESAVLPIPPPDVLLIPMTLAKPARWARLAAWTTTASVLGGTAGYLLGIFAFESLSPLIQDLGYGESLEQARALFAEWGVWAMLVAGFSPIPYKLFTITAGMMSMMFLPFVLASIVGRSARFFLLAFVIAKAGPKLEPVIVKYIEWFGWCIVLGFVGLVLFYGLR